MGCNIQMWITPFEQVSPDLIGYNVELLEVILSDDMETKEVRKTIEAEVQESLRRRRGRRLLPIHCPEMPEHPGDLWTLLSLERKDEESPLQVRYFETLDEANDVFEPRTQSAQLVWSGSF